jgi:tellurite resistance protein TehA-like permease
LPLLLVLNVWRVFVRRDPLRGGWAEWSAVFPLGMYSVATGKMAAVFGVDGLLPLSAAFFWIAAAAWLATALSTMHRLAQASPGRSRRGS